MLAIDTTPLPRRRRTPTFLVTALVVTVAGACGVFVAARRTVDAVPRVDGVAAVLSPASSTIDNYLLVGSDTRQQGDPNTGAGASGDGGRSDTIMVLRYDKESGSAALLSLPRDLYLDIAGQGKQNRINAAYRAGPETLVRTVQETLGIPVHHYVEIDFVGFKSLVEALGGVTVCFRAPTRDTNTGLQIKGRGCYLLDGTMALAYARSRHYEEYLDGQWTQDPTSDLGRSKRQRAFVNACLQETITQLKSNPFRAGELIDAIGAAIRIDGHLDPIEAGGSLRSAVADGLGAYALPVYPFTTPNGDAVLGLADGAQQVLDFFRGVGPAPATTA